MPHLFGEAFRILLPVCFLLLSTAVVVDVLLLLSYIGLRILVAFSHLKW